MQETEAAKKFVIKRDGTKAEIQKHRIKERLSALCDDTLNMDYINIDIITEKVYKGIHNGKYIRKALLVII